MRKRLCNRVSYINLRRQDRFFVFVDGDNFEKDVLPRKLSRTLHRTREDRQTRGKQHRREIFPNFELAAVSEHKSKTNFFLKIYNVSSYLSIFFLVAKYHRILIIRTKHDTCRLRHNHSFWSITVIKK